MVSLKYTEWTAAAIGCCVRFSSCIWRQRILPDAEIYLTFSLISWAAQLHDGISSWEESAAAAASLAHLLVVHGPDQGGTVPVREEALDGGTDAVLGLDSWPTAPHWHQGCLQIIPCRELHTDHNVFCCGVWGARQHADIGAKVIVEIQHN